MAYLDAGACSVPLRPTTRALANVSCVGDGSPALRKTGNGSRRGEGLPGYWTILFIRAMVEHPAGYAPLLAHFAQRALLPSSNSAPWASGKSIGFGAACSMAHTFACLRIAEAISGTGARLATGSGGLTLGRAGFAPAGRQTKFHEGIVSSLPFDQHCLVALKFLSAPRVAPLLGFLQQMLERPFRHALAPVRRGRAHRRDFSVLRVEGFESTTPS